MNAKICMGMTAACVFAGALTVGAQGQGQPTRPGEPAPMGQPGMPSVTQPSAETLVVTGCLVKDAATGDSGAGRSSVQAAQDQAKGMFKLTNVRMGAAESAAGITSTQSAAGSSSASRSGDSTTNRGAGSAAVPGNQPGQVSPGGVSAAPATEYRLVAGANVDLSKHVNHQMQVTGTLSTNTSAMTSRPGSSMGSSSGSSNAPGAGSSSNSGSGSSSDRPSQGSASSSAQGSGAGDAAVPVLMVASVTMLAPACQQ